jgi:L-ascorbate metabolism protein UlaG (beta-lactamase superfamily)
MLLLGLMFGAFVVSGCKSFGAKPEGARLARVQQSPQWHEDGFENPQPIWTDTSAAWRRFLFGPATPGVEPDGPVPVVRDGASAFATPPATGLRVTWFGHSSALVEIDGSNVLIDPLWSERASPVAWAGPKRWYSPPVSLRDLPTIDVVVISHDHYDHLDRDTILAMKSWRTIYVVPLGVGAHLSRWGIPGSRIIELDWWQSARVGGVELTATPSRHRSGRTSTQTNKTLWAGYAIVGTQHRVWYSGDSGFHEDLPKIGERLGPFDVTLIDAGQYDASWPDTHLGPELAVEAHRQVRGRTMIPVHWALLKLAQHGWTEPIERVLVAAQCRAVTVLVPRPGESVEPTRLPQITRWWPRTPWQSAAQSPIVATRSGVPSNRVDIRRCSRTHDFAAAVADATGRDAS